MPGVPVTAASYNIRKAVGADLRRRPERILAVLAEIAPDVAVLQEADRRFGTRASALPPDLVNAGGFRAVPLPGPDRSIGWHGNALLIGPRAQLIAATAVEIPALEPRGAIIADLSVGGALLRVAGMHLDLSGLMRRRQARAILGHLALRPPAPTLLMGDLNEWRPAAGCIADFMADFHRLPLGFTFPAGRPIAALDRVFLSDDITADDYGVHRSPASRVASDHLPVWVRLTLPGPGTGGPAAAP